MFEYQWMPEHWSQKFWYNSKPIATGLGMQRVVITGIGIYSTIGRNLNEVKKSLYDGTSGIGIDPVRKEMGFRSALTGVIEKPVLKGVLPRRLRVGLAEQGEYAYLSTQEALRFARIDEEFLQQKEVGIIFGNDSSALAVIESTDILREKKSTMFLGTDFSVDEFHGDDESVLHLHAARDQFHIECRLCEWVSCDRHGVRDDSEWHAGRHNMRRRTGD
jgi:hypothetical protein